MRRVAILLLCLLVPAAAIAGECVWGSFDASRINYPGGPLTGTEHSSLRTIVTANGGTIAPPTPTLTGAYLSGVDIFYTSLLNTNTGTLSAAEQAALHTWIDAGGTLIVTGDIFPLPAYESFTAFYGVTNYTAISAVGNGTVVAAHPITLGVSAFFYNTNCTFTHGADGLLLGRDMAGNLFMVVLEPATGFPHPGRILILGDHNMFTNSSIGSADNTRLATNIAMWACEATTGVEPTSWGTIKAIYGR